MGRRQILKVKIVYPLTEYLSLVIGFDSKTQLGMQSSETLFQKLKYVLEHAPVLIVDEVAILHLYRQMRSRPPRHA